MYYNAGGVVVKSGAISTVSSYIASVVNFYNATGSLARFENIFFKFYFEKTIQSTTAQAV
jgi:vacuolar-type H+-ATPase subunit C/Vma6